MEEGSDVEQERGELEEAEALSREALAARREVLGSVMTVADGYPAVGMAEFNAEYDVELSFKEGEALTVLDVQAPEGWLMARNASGAEGLVPESYLSVPGRGRLLADFVAETLHSVPLTQH